MTSSYFRRQQPGRVRGNFSVAGPQTASSGPTPQVRTIASNRLVSGIDPRVESQNASRNKQEIGNFLQNALDVVPKTYIALQRDAGVREANALLDDETYLSNVRKDPALYNELQNPWAREVVNSALANAALAEIGGKIDGGFFSNPDIIARDGSDAARAQARIAKTEAWKTIVDGSSWSSLPQEARDQARGELLKLRETVNKKAFQLEAERQTRNINAQQSNVIEGIATTAAGSARAIDELSSGFSPLGAVEPLTEDQQKTARAQQSSYTRVELERLIEQQNPTIPDFVSNTASTALNLAAKGETEAIRALLLGLGKDANGERLKIGSAYLLDETIAEGVGRGKQLETFLLTQIENAEKFKQAQDGRNTVRLMNEKFVEAAENKDPASFNNLALELAKKQKLTPQAIQTINAGAALFDKTRSYISEAAILAGEKLAADQASGVTQYTREEYIQQQLLAKIPATRLSESRFGYTDPGSANATKFKYLAGANQDITQRQLRVTKNAIRQQYGKDSPYLRGDTAEKLLTGTAMRLYLEKERAYLESNDNKQPNAAWQKETFRDSLLEAGKEIYKNILPVVEGVGGVDGAAVEADNDIGVIIQNQRAGKTGIAMFEGTKILDQYLADKTPENVDNRLVGDLKNYAAQYWGTLQDDKGSPLVMGGGKKNYWREINDQVKKEEQEYRKQQAEDTPYRQQLFYEKSVTGGMGPLGMIDTRRMMNAGMQVMRSMFPDFMPREESDPMGDAGVGVDASIAPPEAVLALSALTGNGQSAYPALQTSNEKGEKLQAMVTNLENWPLFEQYWSGAKKGFMPNTPALPQVESGKPVNSAPTMMSNSNHPHALLIGMNEGTRDAKGNPTRAYYGHTDPGNGRGNQGTFSAQQGYASAEQADRAWVRKINAVTLSTFTPALRAAGLTPGVAAYERILFNLQDLYVQAPAAATGRGGLVDRIPEILAAGATIEVIAKARADSFFRPGTDVLDAPGFGNNYARLSSDQRRRAGTWDYKRRLG